MQCHDSLNLFSFLLGGGYNIIYKQICDKLPD